MISIGKKLWNASIDWIRVARARGSATARERAEAAHLAFGSSTDRG